MTQVRAQMIDSRCGSKHAYVSFTDAAGSARVCARVPTRSSARVCARPWRNYEVISISMSVMYELCYVSGWPPAAFVLSRSPAADLDYNEAVVHKHVAREQELRRRVRGGRYDVGIVNELAEERWGARGRAWACDLSARVGRTFYRNPRSGRVDAPARYVRTKSASAELAALNSLY
ncbi:unnamed protein product, partial [Iphiclides podalirius]